MNLVAHALGSGRFRPQLRRGGARAGRRGPAQRHADQHQGHRRARARAPLRRDARRRATPGPAPRAPRPSTPPSPRSTPSRATRSSPRRSPTWARSTPILYQGAIPVFADVDPATCNVTADDDRRPASSERTRAIVVTHLFGNPCDMAPILELAQSRGDPGDRGLRAGVPGARTRGRLVGTIGAIGCFSLQQGKHITTRRGRARRHQRRGPGAPHVPVRQQGLGLRRPGPGPRLPRPQLPADRAAGRGGAGAAPQARGVVDRRGSPTPRGSPRRSTASPGIATPAVRPGDVHTLLALRPAASIRGVIPGRRRWRWRPSCKARGIASAPRYIQKPAFRCEVFARQRTFGTSRWPFTLARPEALDYAAGRSRASSTALEGVLVLPWNERFEAERRRFPRARRSARPPVALAAGGGMSAPLRFGLVGAGRHRRSLRPGVRAVRDGRRRHDRRRSRTSAPRPRAALAGALGLSGASRTYEALAAARRARRRHRLHAAGHARRDRAPLPAARHPRAVREAARVDSGSARLHGGTAARRAGVAAHHGVEVPLRRGRRPRRGRLVDRRADRRGRAVRERLHLPRRHGGALELRPRALRRRRADRQRHPLGRLCATSSGRSPRCRSSRGSASRASTSRTRPPLRAHARGVLGSIDLSWSVDKEIDSYLNLYGSRGHRSTSAGGSRAIGATAEPATGSCSAPATTRSRLSGADRATSRAPSGGGGAADHGRGRPRLGRGRSRPPTSRSTAAGGPRSPRSPPIRTACAGRAASRLVAGGLARRPAGGRQSHPAAIVHPTAVIEDGVEIGAGTAIWDSVHIRDAAPASARSASSARRPTSPTACGSATA